MPAAKKQPPPKREYPAIYEKFVPFALGLVGLAILILVVITIIVALGLFPGGG